MSFSPNSQQIKTLFNQIAPVYDQMNDGLSFGIHHIWKAMTVKWSNPPSSGVALDLCCGTGDLTFLMAKQMIKGKVIGVDFSSQLLAEAKIKQAHRSLSSEIEWLEEDVLNLPFDDNYVDCATMGYGLRNVVNIPACLREIRRVLKPLGKVAILDFHKPEADWVASSQKWYLDNVVVRLADFLGIEAEYAYIYPSLERFPDGKTQINLALDAGFQEAVHYPLFGGIMGVLVLTK
ncbi:bifunctional demethylmenaquinone methyltransferase/2-methoxy-6-polyprenyl-1,4-benzoquinol methylase UbiE [Geminocystis sp. NIES-3709]|uniref:bifunctional demethylmenaquinone methyltransferase/2-methoxy-6-polyprenyl-1,4-benzoquinol methylase UbiE n=1 Tax=Geminocystis sp. NIES-3709 TaxID=1617448 RepID=UPI0005FCB4DB|nr:bifunctional demethylmenaquinone methyltransferase/2-methoxy-6-polyprenyl-1,4-benzoquinol methylase UbiE [Geminocystis sp. NIES-3709]BAQ64789.1 2-heptaprenyl-1,4-naphthoquinone methyltransferase MenG [Geminocystis sp. NIES-3709]